MNPNKNHVLVIAGSSRKNSNTLKAIQSLVPFPKYDLIDLHLKEIGYYSYGPNQLRKDDFHSIAVQMLTYDVIIFATPVYWYTMSGQMKVFFDRLTELTDEYKPMGKALKGKKTYLIACGGSPSLPEGFEVPFKLTSEYFDMEYIQGYYQQIR